MTRDGVHPPVVEARGLLKKYGAITAVDRVDLEVRPGDVYGLLGPNGAGKTTFMRMLFGLIRPDEGSVSIRGVDVHPNPVSALAGVAGFVETPRFYPYLTGRQNLRALARLDGGIPGRRIDEVLETVDLTRRAGSRVREYSYGMVQRLGVAAALMRDPHLLVLDEPTNGLDPAGIRDMRALVQRLAGSGITVLLSSHNMDEVDEICDKVAIMRAGALAFDGTMEELRSRAQVALRHLRTTDNERALEILRSADRVSEVRDHGRHVAFDASDDTVVDVASSLVTAGVGIHALHAPTSALETLFFRLTEDDTDEEEAA